MGREFTRVAQALQIELEDAKKRGKEKDLISQTIRKKGWVVRFGGLKADTRSFITGSSDACPSYRSSALGELSISEHGSFT